MKSLVRLSQQTPLAGGRGGEGRRAGASVTFALSFVTLAKPSFAKKKQINRKVDNAIHWINLQPMDSEPLG